MNNIVVNRDDVIAAAALGDRYFVVLKHTQVSSDNCERYLCVTSWGASNRLASKHWSCQYEHGFDDALLAEMGVDTDLVNEVAGKFFYIDAILKNW